MKCLLALLSLFSMPLVAQQAADSVQFTLDAYRKEDSVKVEMLIDACVNNTFTADERTLLWAEQAKALAEKLQYKLGIIRAVNCLGNYYYQRGLYDKSLPYYYDALRKAEHRKDIKNIIIGKSNVANVFTHTKRLPEAITLFKDCDALLLTNRDSLTQNRAAVLTNLATAYSANNQHDSAVYHYKKVYRICEQLNIGFGLGLTQSNLASEYLFLNDYPSALAALQQAEAYSKKYHLDFLNGNIYKNYGRVYLLLGQLDKGINFLEKSIAIARQNKDLSSLTASYQDLYKAQRAQGKYKAALQNATEFILLNDSLFNVTKERTIAELNTKYETEKKEIAINQLQQEKTIAELQSQQKDTLLYTLLGIAALAIASAFALFARYKTKKENQVLNATLAYEQNLNKSILTSIKAQMNPHFFYNALNTIQSYIFADDKRNATAYLSKFSSLTRMILEMSEKERVPLSQEIKALTLYLEIEKARFNNDFQFTLQVAPFVDTDMLSIPSMIIQPYVENAVKHGLLHKRDSKQLVISFTRDNGSLIVTVDDNGIGRKRSEEINQVRSERHQSFSTQANQKRLELLNQGRSKKVVVLYTDKVSDDGTAAGTTVTLTIPV